MGLGGSVVESSLCPWVLPLGFHLNRNPFPRTRRLDRSLGSCPPPLLFPLSSSAFAPDPVTASVMDRVTTGLLRCVSRAPCRLPRRKARRELSSVVGFAF